MNILTLSGSTSLNSSNIRLLQSLTDLFPNHHFSRQDLGKIPMFLPDAYTGQMPPEVQEWKKRVVETQALIISTPEYLHNIPAVLKSALEWLTESGELSNKPVLAITYTPLAPR